MSGLGRTATTLSSILRNCIPLSAISPGKQTHLQIIVHGLLPNVTLQTDLLLLYSRSSHLKLAHRVFAQMTHTNTHSWNIIISSYTLNSLFYHSLTTFHQFLNMGFRPDHFTFPSVFKACGGIGDSSLRLGNGIHTWVVKLGFKAHVVVGCSILDFYVKSENLVDARRFFGEMLFKDAVVWNSMISGFARAGYSLDALSYFKKMQGQGVKMDSRTLPSILSVCGRVGDLARGKELHVQVVKDVGFSGDVAIANSLIDMYAKCGCLDGSQKVIANMSKLNVVTWTTFISCYGAHGKGEESLIQFEKMKVSGYDPNRVTFTALLASCSHSGLIEQGRRIFHSISTDFGMIPSVEHYACMVDLLGRSGSLKEALRLIREMPQEPPSSVWGALLGASRMHNNVEIGEIAAYRLFQLEPGNSSNYVALCSIYESVGRWDGISKIRSRMRELGLVKKPGYSWVSINGRVCYFYQGDISHTQTKIICETLDEMIKAIMFSDGYG